MGKLNALQFLGYGEQNAIKREQLARVMGVNERTAREAIRKLRMSGYAVVNNGRGYYLAETAGEVDKECRKMYSHAFGTLGIAIKMKQNFENFNQIKIDMRGNTNGINH